MTWFGTVSAWGAVVVGLLFGVLAALSLDWQSLAVPVLNSACVSLLIVAAFRTLQQMSGGLRLLCGAWGLVTGLSIERLFYFGELHLWGQIAAAIAAIACVGLALTVLHKEKK